MIELLLLFVGIIFFVISCFLIHLFTILNKHDYALFIMVIWLYGYLY
jgi:hypothetical protein